MNTNRIFRNKQTHIATCISLAVTFLICIATNSLAQQKPGRKVPIQLAHSDSMKIPHKKIMEDPTLTTKEPDCEVTGFTITFIPIGGYLSGPYKTSGNKIQGNQLSYLKEFTNMNIKIVFEDIQLKCKGKDSVGGTLFVTSLSE